MDWADEKALEIFRERVSDHVIEDFSATVYINPKHLHDEIAQALRDIQRETAETCARLAGMTIVVPKNGDCVLAVTKQLQDSVNAIKKRFNLLGDEQ